MAFTQRVKTAIEQPQMVKTFLQDRFTGRHVRRNINELLCLVRRRKFGAVLGYLLAGVTGQNPYDAYLTGLADRRENPRTLVDVRDYEMFVDPHDMGISKQLYLYGTHEDGPATEYEAELRTVSQAVDTPLVIEVGANIGYYAILAANAADRNCEIIAIEPSESNITLLERNIEHNGIDDFVSIHRAAVGSETGVAMLEYSDKSNRHCIVGGPSPVNTGNSEQVPMWRLDEFLIDHHYDPADVTAVRMDIEGLELDAMAGMGEIIHAKGPTVLYIEVHNNFFSSSQARELPRELSEAGFEICTTQWDAVMNSPFDLSFGIDDWEELHTIPLAYSLIAKKPG